MAFTDFFRHNLAWKTLSFFLAVLIWLNVRQSLDRPGGPDASTSTTRTFDRLPIRVLTLAADLNRFRVQPAEVSVVLSARPALIDRLTSADVEVYVNLTASIPAAGQRQAVHVNAPGAQVLSVSPTEVLIQALAPPDKTPAELAPPP